MLFVIFRLITAPSPDAGIIAIIIASSLTGTTWDKRHRGQVLPEIAPECMSRRSRQKRKLCIEKGKYLGYYKRGRHTHRGPMIPWMRSSALVGDRYTHGDYTVPRMLSQLFHPHGSTNNRWLVSPYYTPCREKRSRVW
jgi:hypothetical protein